MYLLLDLLQLVSSKLERRGDGGWGKEGGREGGREGGGESEKEKEVGE